MMLLFFYKAKVYNNSPAGKTITYFSKTTNGKINVQIKAVRNSNVEFYLFDFAGELTEKKIIETKSILTLSEIKKGEYLYQCFEKDIQLTSGKLSINQNRIIYN